MKKVLVILLAIVLLAAMIFAFFHFYWTAENFAAQGARAMSRGDYEKAVSRYTRAVDMNPESIPYALALADACVANGSYTKAERALVSAIRTAPHAELYAKLSAVYVAQDKLLDAQQMLDSITDESVRTEIAAMRPDAPVLSHESGEYSSFISISASVQGGTVYVSTDEQFPSLEAAPFTEAIPLPAGATHLTALCVAENGLVSTLVEADYLIVGVVEDVIFADAQLESYVRELIFRPGTGTITTDELWDIEELVVPETVADYSDLRHFTGLKSLTILGGDADDYAFLAALEDLEYLNLSGSLVSFETLEKIGLLPNLRELNLSSCGLSNILPLAEASTMTAIDLSDNSISNIGALSACKNLATVNLSRNALTSLDAISEIDTLQELDVSENNLTSISALSECTALTHLNASDNSLSSIAAVSSLKKLREFYAAKNALSDIEGLEACMLLERLDLSNNSLTSIGAVANLVNLTYLNFNYNDVEVLPSFSSSAKLQQFYAAHNFLEDISGLAGLSLLNYVDVDYNNVTDIECLHTCPTLVQVNAFGTNVESVTKLTDIGVIVYYDPT
ncbi:MAG: leucine-rich repeat domain-containing protein [Oscillospiraceae bacterium]|jgi:tetratricopeptide (TPR) repeat protein|nr:leucine-rich repeat domain-containing protein [Oscillospiraceae bacterium]